MTSSIRLLSFVMVTSVVSGVLLTSESYVNVTTKYGAVRGFRTKVDEDISVDTFLGLPYAQPPVGPLRFRPTQPLTGWSEVWDATKRDVPQCIQPKDLITEPDRAESEDCLYLNVYTPRFNDPESSNRGRRSKYPVFVFVHGGSYVVGTGIKYDGTMLSAQGVVVVTINYRLDALGFLSTEDDAAMGNYGAYDVIQTLEWVRDVIDAFDGDENSVTLAGHSAGSSMVSLLLTCQRARGLFHKAVMFSGQSLAPFALSLMGTLVEPRPVKYAEQLGRDLDCDVSDHVAMVECLRQKNASDFRKASKKRGFEMVFLPMVSTGRNDSLFTLLPEVAFANQSTFAQVPTIRGYNNFDWGSTGCFGNSSGAGRALLKYMNGDHSTATNVLTQPAFNGTFSNKTALIRPYLDQETIRELMQVFHNRGHVNDSLEKKICLASGKSWTDLMFGAPAVKELQLSSSLTQRPQYLYNFAHAEHRNHLSLHGDDTAFVFGFPHRYNSSWGEYHEFQTFPKQWSDTDRQLSSLVMTMWVDFIKFGNPTPTQGGEAIKWLPWKQATPRYLEISLNASMREGPKIPSVVFPYPLAKAMLYKGAVSNNGSGVSNNGSGVFNSGVFNSGSAVTVQYWTLAFVFLAVLYKD